jgi:hypothetical protein
MPRRDSIRILRSLAAFPLLAFLATPGRAQMHKVEAPQRVTRAVGVYEWTGPLAKPTAARLIPVSLFIDGHFEDAGVYLARPVPFAIETGDIYSIQQGGKSLGTLDIDFARDVVTRRSVADDDPLGAWYGYGRFAPPPTLTVKSNLHPSANPSAIVASNDDSSDTPHFVYRQPSSSTTTTTSSNGSTTTTTTATTPVPDDADDPDRPTLRHRDPSDDAKRTKRNSKPQGYVTPPNNSLNDDPDRPTLHRGIPAEEAMASQLTGLPKDMHQDAAVSDAANREPHLFAREWASPTERAETLADLEVAARPRIANYLLTNKLTAAPPAPPLTSGPSFAQTPSYAKTSHQTTRPSTAHTAAARRAAARRKSTATPPPAFPLANEQLSGYTLSYGGLPTFIYTVETPTTLGTPVYLTLVAQRLPAGELQVALSSITDAGHLDRTPWMRPIDVVDADASHRASLLMELRAQSSRQFALYQLVTAKAEQTFVTGIIE